MLDTNEKKLSGLNTYIDGKMQRYKLLFAVNGGAFAIAQLVTGNNKAATSILLGHLRLWHLAVGSIIFTVLMVIDIYLWGQMMRNNFLGNFAFNLAGKSILLLLGMLIIAAWVLVAIG